VPSREELLDIEAEILRYLWYEGRATPLALAGKLQKSLPVLYDCLEDLARRECVFEFLPSYQRPDASIYCLTRRAYRTIQKALRGYSRYKLKSFWDALKREERLFQALFELE